MSARPTLADVRAWPATVSVELAASALGISRSHAYSQVRLRTFPVATLQVGGRVVVLTHSLRELLEGLGACDGVTPRRIAAGQTARTARHSSLGHVTTRGAR